MALLHGNYHTVAMLSHALPCAIAQYSILGVEVPMWWTSCVFISQVIAAITTTKHFFLKNREEGYFECSNSGNGLFCESLICFCFYIAFDLKGVLEICIGICRATRSSGKALVTSLNYSIEFYLIK